MYIVTDNKDIKVNDCTFRSGVSALDIPISFAMQIYKQATEGLYSKDLKKRSSFDTHIRFVYRNSTH